MYAHPLTKKENSYQLDLSLNEKHPPFHTTILSRLTSVRMVTDFLDAARLPVFKKVYESLTRIFVQARAFIRHKSFYCAALYGTSDYSISINSDMTVSCNCHDNFHEGILGDLSKEEFKDIFHGSVANSFRHKLSKGILPTSVCSRCAELIEIDRREAPDKVHHHAAGPGGIMVENTVRCNLDCVSCVQTKMVKSRYKVRMTLDDIRKASRIIHDHGIPKLFFFKFGEPFLSPTVYEELEIIRNQNPSLVIVISTNGAMIDTGRKREAALFADYMFFSIPGVTNSIVAHYQRGGSFTKAYENMKAVVRLRNEKGLKKPVIDWKYVLFNWNDRPEMIDYAIELAQECGIDIISFWHTFSPYYGTSLGRYHTKVAAKCWKGWEIRFSDAGDIR